MSLIGLYPVGEGAGYAGGIVSAAVDGMYTGFSVAKTFDLFHGDRVGFRKSSECWIGEVLEGIWFLLIL